MSVASRYSICKMVSAMLVSRGSANSVCRPAVASFTSRSPVRARPQLRMRTLSMASPELVSFPKHAKRFIVPAQSVRTTARLIYLLQPRSLATFVIPARLHCRPRSRNPQLRLQLKARRKLASLAAPGPAQLLGTRCAA